MKKHLIVIGMTLLFLIVGLSGCMEGITSVDTDGDDYYDDIDAFPNDETEWVDSDGDGVGGNESDIDEDKNDNNSNNLFIRDGHISLRPEGLSAYAITSGRSVHIGESLNLYVNLTAPQVGYYEVIYDWEIKISYNNSPFEKSPCTVEIGEVTAGKEWNDFYYLDVNDVITIGASSIDGVSMPPFSNGPVKQIHLCTIELKAAYIFHTTLHIESLKVRNIDLKPIENNITSTATFRVDGWKNVPLFKFQTPNNIYKGEIFYVTIHITAEDTPVGGWEIDIEYNPNVLEAEKVTINYLWDDYELGDIEYGSITGIKGTTSYYPPPNYEMDLCTIKFEAINSGTSELEFSKYTAILGEKIEDQSGGFSTSVSFGLAVKAENSTIKIS